MQRQQFDLQLELEKVKLGGENDDYIPMFLDIFAPMVKEFMANKNNTQQGGVSPQGFFLPPQRDINTPPADLKEMTQEERLEEYKKKIRAGEIDEETAYKDFLAEPMPDYIKKMTSRERFHKEYEKIKNS